MSSDSQILFYHLSQYLFVILLPDCGSVVNNTLKSPNYPEGYPNNMECEFKVPIPSGFRLNITFEYEVAWSKESLSVRVSEEWLLSFMGILS